MTEYGSVLDGHIVPGEPLVSVNVITYNHGKYVRQCLDGILMQKVNFPYEVLVHDDASPDDTADIIREYEARFPTVIKPIYQTENQYSQGKSVSKFNIDRAKGKYIAQCEGDDYWTDPGKLQMQVDFLEEHPEYVGCAHSVLIVDINGIPRKEYEQDEIKCYSDNHEYTAKDLANRFIPGQTASLVYRNIWCELDDEILQKYYACQCHGDRKFAVLLTMLGKIYCFGKKMSHYRLVIDVGTSANATFSKLPPAKWSYVMEKNKREFAYDVFGYSIDFDSTIGSLVLSGLIFFIRHPSINSLKDVLWVICDCNVKFSSLIVIMYRKVINYISRNLKR